MPSSSFLRLSTAATAVAAFNVVDFVVALPSFGAKIPNGELVPCPSSLLEDNSSGCTASGYCFGLGHPNCGGFQSEDKIEGNPPTIFLSPFGEDWRSNGFVWTKELCELDSDQDGFTNGEELGDPCCVWSVGSSQVMLDSVDGFLPSHPGMKDHTPPVGFTFDKTFLCATDNLEETDDDTTEADVDAYDQYYNPEETRGSFEFRIKPYPIPIKTTTYVDFIFNIPEDAPESFHVVFGETLISQPDHLHHFVIHGCSKRIETSLEGVPIDRPPTDCQEIMIGAWAPGSDLFSNNSLDTGILLGRSMGIESLQLNVHYTDGVYENPETLTHKMATDGIRIHYTTDFRPFTSFRKNIIFVPFGPPEMVIPPNESRSFLSKTCNVNTSCKDIGDKTLQAVARFMGVGNAGGTDDLSCAGIKAFCRMDGQLGSSIQQLCPVTCGLCGDTVDGEKNPRNPGSYRVTSVSYHAHLLGTEMYTTLLREYDDEASLLEQGQPQDVAIIQKQASTASNTRATRMVAKDLKSREIWYYDDQSSIPLDYDIEFSDPTDAATTSMIQGTEVKPGDKIQVTCVYDSTDRSEETRFGLSTYSEMCIIGLIVTFDTPQSLLENTEDAAGLLDVYTDVKLRSFTCDTDDENYTSDVYQGFLTQAEDARNIWFEHPIEESGMCTFPVENYVIVENVMTQKTRNCPMENDDEAMEGGEQLCYGISSSNDVEFLEDVIAGYVCEGGDYDQKDSNEAPFYVTEKDCLEVGGGSEYVAYSCAVAQLMADTTNEVVEYMIAEWWQPKCCRHQSDGDDIGDGKPSGEDESESADDNALPSRAARGFSTHDNVLEFLTAATIVSIIR